MVLVGGGVAAWRSARELRRSGYTGCLIVVGGAVPLPYDRPPLSKDFITRGLDPAEIALIGPEELKKLRVEQRHDRVAVQLDVDLSTLILDDGEQIRFDALVISTGTAPVKPDIPGVRLPGVHTLRDLSDATAVRHLLAARPKVAVIGGGFIGCEFAASCRELGLQVSIVETNSLLLERQMGTHFARFVTALHQDAGVDLHCGAPGVRIIGDQHVAGVLLQDNSTVSADLVVMALGSTPRDAWLSDSGIPISDGVCVDEWGWAGANGVYAAGDVASWYSTLLNRNVRVEHWTTAVEQGRAVARNILGHTVTPLQFNQVPYFWTDQYNMRAQLVGFATKTETVCKGPTNNSFAVLYAHERRLVGVLAINWPRLALLARQAVRSAGDTDTAGPALVSQAMQ